MSGLDQPAFSLQRNRGRLAGALHKCHVRLLVLVGSCCGRPTHVSTCIYRHAECEVAKGFSTDMQRLSASLSSASSFSAPIRPFTVGPTIVPRRFATGKRNPRGVPGVTALESLQVGSLKVERENLRGPATTDVAMQARIARENFMFSSSRVVVGVLVVGGLLWR
jgi:hypothetical protein